MSRDAIPYPSAPSAPGSGLQRPAAAFALVCVSFTVQPSASAQTAFAGRIVTSFAEGAEDVHAADLDGDGDLDVLSASSDDNKIAWYENDGGVPTGFTEHIISLDALRAEDVHAADVDGDGHVDVLSASFGDDKIAWYENDGGTPPGFTEHVVSTADRGARSVFAADIDSDGDTDLLSAADRAGRVSWYANDGHSPPGFTQRIITFTAAAAWAVSAADMDGDGDVDVLSASAAVTDDTLKWFENDGGATPSFVERIISEKREAAFDVVPADIDGDGDLDVLAVTATDDTVAWYENDGATPPGFTERVVSSTAGFPQAADTADVDGDGDRDLLTTSITDSRVSWWENDGQEDPAFAERVITDEAHLARSVFAADVDGDGHSDVLWTSERDNTVTWHEQLLGLGVDGGCPGVATLQITGAPPSSEVGVVGAATTTGFIKGGLLCNGTALEIGEPFRLPPTFVPVDASGRGSAQIDLSADFCWLEAIALASCETSGAVSASGASLVRKP